MPENKEQYNGEDLRKIVAELGDVLLLVYFHAQIAEEKGLF